MPTMPTTLTKESEELRADLLLTSAVHLQKLVMIPVTQYDPDGAAYALAAAEAVLPAVEALVKVPTRSSDAYYAEGDLPDDDRDALQSIRHSVKVLRALYGPKES